MASKRITNYTFDKSTRKVTFTDYAAISLEGIKLVTNTTSNIIIYNFADPLAGGTVATNVLTLTYDTSSMANTDKLMILYDDGLVESVQYPITGNLQSPFDFSVEYTSSISLTCSGAPVTIDSENVFIRGIFVRNSSNIITKYVNGNNGVSIYATSDIIYIIGAGTPFANTDLTYTVICDSSKQGFDPTIDAFKYTRLDPDWNRYTDVEGLVTSAQNVSASWADFGAEIDVRTYTNLIVWLTITHNNSVDNRIKALVKHTYAGTDEYELPIKTVNASAINVLTGYYEFDSDVTQKVAVSFDVKNVPYVQLQIQCGTVGATADTFVAYITKMY